MPKYTHILWDWDGCIAKTLHVWIKEYTRTFAKEEIIKTKQQIIASMGSFRKDIESWGYSAAEATRMVETTHARVVPQLTNVLLYPHANNTTSSLKRLGYKQSVVTTSRRHYVESAAHYNNIAANFDAFVCANDVTHQKPHHESIEVALKKLSGVFKRAVLIGDSKKDLQTVINAKAAGINVDSILYYPKENQEFYKLSDLKKFKPAEIITDLREVLSIVA